jgi:hypothetical protein
MSVLSEIQGEVNEIAADRGFKDYQAFAYWFLEGTELFSKEEAIDLVTDRAWDEGRDAVYRDEPNRELRIYQFKYSDSKSYVLDAFKDIQRGLVYEEGLGNLKDIDRATCYVVTTHSAAQTSSSKARRRSGASVVG